MDHYVRPENQWPAVLRVNVEYSEPVESAEADIGIEGLYMFLFGIQSAVRSLDRERHSGIIRNLVQEPAATEEDVLTSQKMQLVLRDPRRKVVAFIVKVQLQFQVLHQISLESDRREMLNIGTIFMKLRVKPAFRQSSFVLIAEYHPCVMRHVPNQAWTHRPQEHVSLGKGLIEASDSGSSI